MPLSRSVFSGPNCRSGMATAQTGDWRPMKVATSDFMGSDNFRAMAMSSTVSLDPVSMVAVRFGRPPIEHLTAIKCPRCSLNGTFPPRSEKSEANDKIPTGAIKTNNNKARFNTPPVVGKATGTNLGQKGRRSPEERLMFQQRFSEFHGPQLFLTFSTPLNHNLSYVYGVEFGTHQ